MENKKENKTLFLSLVGVLTLIAAISGATYAWFSISTTATNRIEGSAATAAELGLVVTQNLPVDKTAKLVPQVGTAIDSAVAANCIDGNSNAVCQTYEIVVTNTSQATVELNGSITFSGIDNMSNLKYAVSKSATSGFTNAVAASTTKTDFETNLKLDSGDSSTIYIVVWINEANQIQTDSGEFTATVTYNASNGQGVTSTITS